jgi:hypothetical protein
MPAPWLTIDELQQQAHTRNVDPLTYILETATTYQWTDTQTLNTIRALQRPTRSTTTPTTFAELQALANELDANDELALNLEDTVASYLSNLWAYEQDGDPTYVDILRDLEQHMARLTNLEVPNYY